MSRALRTELLTKSSADAVVRSLSRNLGDFLLFPCRIVLAMRPQREREAAKIAEEFQFPGAREFVIARADMCENTPRRGVIQLEISPN
jgi:hypothetical protein